MHHTKKTQHSNILELSEAQKEAGDLSSTQVPKDEEAEAPASTSTEVSGGEAQISPPGSPRVSSPSPLMGSIVGRPSDDTSGNLVEEQEEPETSLSNAINANIVNLVDFLLLRFQRKELTTKAEMLDCITGDYRECYPVIFREASECIKLFFGIDMLEVDPVVHAYIPVTALGITYNGMQHGPKGIPNTGLLIISLCIIFMEGSCVSEEMFWKVLDKLGLCDGWGNYVLDEPKKLITEDFVQEGYLEYRQVPDSYPPCYEFLWGPRAHAETTKMQVLNFFASITKTDPKSYPARYLEALRAEQERA